MLSSISSLGLDGSSCLIKRKIRTRLDLLSIPQSGGNIISWMGDKVLSQGIIIGAPLELLYR